MFNCPTPLATEANTKPAMWGRVPNRVKKENIHTTESETPEIAKTEQQRISTDLVQSCPSRVFFAVKIQNSHFLRRIFDVDFFFAEMVNFIDE